MNDPKKFLPSTPYIMYMIERVTMITFQKDCKHEPLRIRPHSGDAPRAALFMPEPQETRGLTQLHLVRVHHCHTRF
jgi:hypothetical protein